MIGSLFDEAGEENVRIIPAITGAEDFSFYANEIPGLFWFLGGKSKKALLKDKLSLTTHQIFSLMKVD
ncbi:hypothetical protein N9B82_01105 [Saprospiraceae bacterium]|nr:hypothetical protein [Saprospiraceae bacterium]